MENKKLNCHRFKTGYLDESGDAGRKGSKCLVLTYMCTSDNKKIAKILKKTKESLRRMKKGKRWLNRHGGEVKFAGFPDKRILYKTIEDLSKLNLQIKFIVIYKKGKAINPKEKAEILPELITSNLVSGEDIPHKIIADKDYFENKKIAYFIVRDFKESRYDGKDGKVKSEVSCKLSLIEKEDLDKNKDSNVIIKIRHENSRQNVELQALDLISGAIFQEMEKDNKTYIEVIRKNNKIDGRIRELK